MAGCHAEQSHRGCHNSHQKVARRELAKLDMWLLCGLHFSDFSVTENVSYEDSFTFASGKNWC
jgi:hypothetical protein